jgi:hypothetical protein
LQLIFLSVNFLRARSRRPRKVLPRAETRENFNKKMLSQDIIIFFSFHFSLQRIMKNIILPLSVCPARKRALSLSPSLRALAKRSFI